MDKRVKICVLVGIILGLLFSILSINSMTACVNEPRGMGVNPCIFKFFWALPIFISLGETFSDYFTNEVLLIKISFPLSGIILGALIGFIFGKIFFRKKI
jgi:uncharacterized membrane protein